MDATTYDAAVADAGLEHWYVTLTLAGERWPAPAVQAALEQLVEEHPFLESCAYTGDSVEVRYWEQAETLHDALAMGLRLWGEYRRTSGLPPWTVVGLEVTDRRTFQRRTSGLSARGVVAPIGDVHPLPASATPCRLVTTDGVRVSVPEVAADAEPSR